MNVFYYLDVPGRRSADAPQGGSHVAGQIAGWELVQQVAIDPGIAFRKHITLVGSTMDNHQDSRDVMDPIWAGKLELVVGRMMSLLEGKRAFLILESGAKLREIMLAP
ncbi:MAG: hypothetical protein PVG71_12545 [Anaerolineae bacterium]|jgi:hypothetical protein